jgi:hypothetical protein
MLSPEIRQTIRFLEDAFKAGVIIEYRPGFGILYSCGTWEGKKPSKTVVREIQKKIQASRAEIEAALAVPGINWTQRARAAQRDWDCSWDEALDHAEIELSMAGDEPDFFAVPRDERVLH